MRIPGIEAPALRIQTSRVDTQSWVAKQLGGQPHLWINPTSWDGVPMRLFGYVVLDYVLNHAKDLEDMRSMVQDALDRTEPGGTVIAFARAFDNGQELAERMVRSGVSPEKLGLSNLSNREIVRLGPASAVLLTRSSVFKPTDSETGDRFRDWVLSVRQSPHAPDIRFEPEKLVTRIVDVGMTWRRH